jgi:hypothetical protein
MAATAVSVASTGLVEVAATVRLAVPVRLDATGLSLAAAVVIVVVTVRAVSKVCETPPAAAW